MKIAIVTGASSGMGRDISTTPSITFGSCFCFNIRSIL